MKVEACPRNDCQKFSREVRASGSEACANGFSNSPGRCASSPTIQEPEYTWSFRFPKLRRGKEPAVMNRCKPQSDSFPRFTIPPRALALPQVQAATIQSLFGSSLRTHLPLRLSRGQAAAYRFRLAARSRGGWFRGLVRANSRRPPGRRAIRRFVLDHVSPW